MDHMYTVDPTRIYIRFVLSFEDIVAVCFPQIK